MSALSLPGVKPASSHSHPLSLDTPSKRSWPWRKHITPQHLLLSYPYAGKGTEESPYILDWLPEERNDDNTETEMQTEEVGRVIDVEYPQTWSAGYKWMITAIGAISVLSVTMTSSMMSAAIFEIRKEFPGHTAEMYIMVTSIFILGFVVGPLLWAPCSEVFGRRRMFIATFIPFTAFNAACCGANSLEAMLVLRFFAGTFGSSSLTSVGGVITDMFNAKERAAAMGIFAIAPFLGPAIGPVSSLSRPADSSPNSTWRWVAALLAFFSAILTVLGALLLPETYEPVLLRRRAAQLSKASGRVYRYSGDLKKPLVTKDLFKKQLTVPWKLLFTEPVAALMALYVSVVYAILYMQFTSFLIVFVQQRGWSPSIAGLAFIGLSVGSILGLMLLGIMGKRYAAKMDANGGYLPPEERLPMVILGGILLPIGLFWFAWSSPNNVHWIVPILATVVFGAALVGLFLGIMSYLVDAYTLHSASALAGNTVVRSIFGVVFPLFTSKMYAALGVQWAGSVVAFIALAFIPAPIIFYKYGAQIRIRSKYAREAELANRALAEKMRLKSESKLNSRAHSRMTSQVELVPAGEVMTLDNHVPGQGIDIGDVEKGLTRPSGGVEGFPVVAAGIGEKLGMVGDLGHDEVDDRAENGRRERGNRGGPYESANAADMLKSEVQADVTRAKWVSAENISLGQPISRVAQEIGKDEGKSTVEKDVGK